MKIAAAYIRVSTEDQIEYSPDSQIKKIKEYAQSHSLMIPDEYIFIDEGISGRHAEKRPEFMKMIGLAKTKPKPFDVILLWKFSRFARNRQDAILYKSMLRKDCGIDVISITEQLSDDPTSILIEALLEAMDEYYSINLAQEVKRGMTEKFSRGGIVSIPSFGYNVVDGNYVPDETKAPIVQMIFRDFADGMPYKQIAQKLNAMGVRTNRGNLFENRTVEYILSNVVYIGKIKWNPDGKIRGDRFHRNENIPVVDSDHQPIISEELFYRVQDRIKEIKSTHTRYSRHEYADFMLKGLLRCSDCGSTLVLSARGQGVQCHKYSKGQCHTSHYVSLNIITDAVINQLEEDIQYGDLTIEVNRRHETDQPIDAVSALLVAEKKKLQRVKEAYEAGIDTIEEYKINKSAIMRRINALEQEARPKQDSQEIRHGTITRKIGEVLQSLRDQSVPEDVKNELLKSFISKIVYDRKNNTFQIYYYI